MRRTAVEKEVNHPLRLWRKVRFRRLQIRQPKRRHAHAGAAEEITACEREWHDGFTNDPDACLLRVCVAGIMSLSKSKPS